MDLQNVMKTLIRYRGQTYKTMGEKLGGITAQGVSGRLNRSSSMAVSTLLKYLEILNYELVIRNKDDARGEWIITESISKGDGE